MWGESELLVRRRSSRISALEEEKRSNAASTSRSNAHLLGDNHHSQNLVTAPRPTAKRGPKRRRLEDVVLSSSQQDDAEDNSIKNEEAANLSSVQQQPEKKVLESILDALQRKDTRNLFGLPVDREKVVSYYSIIKEPMDFATMRAKLFERMYRNFEQFEHDVHLICTNAMHFNASETLYYKEALAIQELAHQIFHALKFEPERLESVLSPKRLCRGRMPQTEAGCSTKKRGRPRGTRTRKQTDSAPRVGGWHKGKSAGLRDGLRLSWIETSRRETYRRPSNENESLVSTVYDLPKSLLPVDSGLGYRESLMRFATGLGPVVQMVVQKKLESLNEAQNCQSKATPAIQAQTSPASTQFAPQLPGYPLGVDRSQMIPMLQNSLLSSPSAQSYGDASLLGYAPSRTGISINEGGYKGQINSPGTSRFGVESNQNDPKGKAVLQAVLGRDAYNQPLQKPMPIDMKKSIDISALATGMGLQGTHQNDNVRLESHIRVVKDFATPGASSNQMRFKTVDMLARRDNQASQLLQQAQMSRASLESNQSRLQEIMSRSRTYLRQSPYLASPAQGRLMNPPVFGAFGANERADPRQWHQRESAGSETPASLLANPEQPNLTLHL